MAVPVDVSNDDPAGIEHPIVLLVLSLEDVRGFRIAKSENLPPPPPKLEISLGDAKVEDAPPPIHVVCIDQREHFTITQKFATQNDFLEWVRAKARKLGFSTVIGKSDNGGNGRSAFVTLIYERGGSYTEYKRKSRREIVGSVKCECPFRLRGYLLTNGDWSLKVGDGKHNHDMTNVLKGHKTFGRLNPNERVHLQEIVDSNIPPRQMLTNFVVLISHWTKCESKVKIGLQSEGSQRQEWGSDQACFGGEDCDGCMVGYCGVRNEGSIY